MFDMPTPDTNIITPPEKPAKPQRLLVLGLGNILLRDEGIGVHVVQSLQQSPLPPNVDVSDAGTAGRDVLLLQQGSYKLLVVDATRAGSTPGTIYKARFEPDGSDKLSRIFGHNRNSEISLHQFGLIDALAAAQKLNCAPDEIVIIGVEPKEIDPGLELTEELQRRLPEILNTVLEEIRHVVYEE